METCGLPKSNVAILLEVNKMSTKLLFHNILISNPAMNIKIQQNMNLFSILFFSKLIWLLIIMVIINKNLL